MRPLLRLGWASPRLDDYTFLFLGDFDLMGGDVGM